MRNVLYTKTCTRNKKRETFSFMNLGFEKKMVELFFWKRLQKVPSFFSITKTFYYSSSLNIPIFLFVVCDQPPFPPVKEWWWWWWWHL